MLKHPDHTDPYIECWIIVKIHCIDWKFVSSFQSHKRSKTLKTKAEKDEGWQAASNREGLWEGLFRENIFTS
jgi:hypothetical protein